MFTTLVHTILPLIGEFFGKLTAIANMNASDFLLSLRLSYPLRLNYVNYFTGLASDFVVIDTNITGIFISNLVIIPAEATRRVLEIFGLSSVMPLWLLMLLFTGVVATVLSLVKLISKVFT